MTRIFFLLILFFLQREAFAYHAYVVNSGGSSVSVVDLSTNALFKTIEVGSGPSFSAITPDKNYIYVPNLNDNTVSIIDTVKNIVIGTESVLNAPFFVTITPDGSSAYISCEGGVSVINTRTQKNIANISTDGNSVFTQILFSPDGKKAYLLIAGFIIEIDTASNQISGQYPITNEFDLSQYPNLIGITANGETIYATNFYDNLHFPMYAIDTETFDFNTIIPNPRNPTVSLVILPNQEFVYVSGAFGNFQIQNYYVYVIEASTNTLSTAIFIGEVDQNANPPVLIATLDGSKVCTSSYNSNNIYFINTIDNSVSDPIQMPIECPNFPTISDDGVFIYLCGIDGTICFINTVTNEISDPIGVGENPNCIIIIPPPKPVSNLKGFQGAESFIVQKEIYNVLDWSLPIGGVTPVSYRIYRNSALTDLAGQTNFLRFIDHNRMPNQVYTYYVVSVSNNGDFSTPTMITIPPI